MKKLLHVIACICSIFILFILSGCSTSDSPSNGFGWVQHPGSNPVYVGNWGYIVDTSEDAVNYGYEWVDVPPKEHPDPRAWKVLPYDTDKDMEALKSILPANTVQELVGIQNSSNTQSTSEKSTMTVKSKTIVNTLKHNPQRGIIEPGIPTTINPNGLGGVYDDFILTTSSTGYSINYSWMDASDSVFALLPGLNENVSYFGMHLTSTQFCNLRVQPPTSGSWFILDRYEGIFESFYHFPAEYGYASHDLYFGLDSTIDLIFVKDTDPLSYVNITSFTGTASGPESVTLNWTAENEINIAGYYILRKEVSDPYYDRVNDTIISSPHSNYTQIYRYFNDEDVYSMRTYTYMLEIVHSNSVSSFSDTISVTTPSIPPVHPQFDYVEPCYPNPNDGGCIIRFALSQPAHLRIQLVNRFGGVVRTLVNSDMNPGVYQYFCDGYDLSADVYRVFYWIEEGDKTYYAYGDMKKY